MINAQTIQGQWNQIKGQVKEKWGTLTDEDLRMQDGNVDQLIGRIQKKTGEAREKIEHYLNEMTSRGSSAVSQAAQSVGDYAHQAGDRLKENWGQVGDQLSDGYQTAQSMVRDRPTESLLAAFGVGIVMGVVVGLALRSR